MQYMHDLGFVHADIKAVRSNSLHTPVYVLVWHNHTDTLFHVSSPTSSLTTRPVHASLTFGQPALRAQPEFLHTTPNWNLWTMHSLPPSS
jgi:hypothetical protein